MRLAYFDESGDDGVPGSSDFFVLSNLYMDERDWKDNFEIIHQFRKSLSEDYGFPVKQELHTNPFLKSKGPLWAYDWTSSTRIEILDRFWQISPSVK